MNMLRPVLFCLALACPAAAFPPPGLGNVLESISFRAEAKQKKEKPRKQKRKKANAGNQAIKTKQLKPITTGAGFANVITLEDRVNERLHQMTAQSGDLRAAQNFEEQKLHRVETYLRIEQERKAILRALDVGSLRASQINTLDGDGFSLLHHVVKSGWTDIAEKLLRAGGDPDIKDVTGRTARDWARILKNPEMSALLETRKAPKKP
ncbi:MAG TPA: ankyrin repeat domain-containing protein [Kiritimatiellia bacterium]|nr:ankyrin repeat domain-containing protein [Kiritimatiellia bacterium]